MRCSPVCVRVSEIEGGEGAVSGSTNGYMWCHFLLGVRSHLPCPTRADALAPGSQTQHLMRYSPAQAGLWCSGFFSRLAAWWLRYVLRFRGRGCVMLVNGLWCNQRVESKGSAEDTTVSTKPWH